jgi:hypothetical protein
MQKFQQLLDAKGMRKSNPKTATDLFAQVEGEPSTANGWLTLEFIGRSRPRLDRAEFRCPGSFKPGYWQQKAKDKDHSFTWQEVAWAVSLFFLDYVSAGLQGAADRFYFSGQRKKSLAASLGDAICKGEGKLFKLFVIFSKDRGESPRVGYVFSGQNPDGKQEGERIFRPQTDNLPFQNVEIFWDSKRLISLSEIQELAEQIRKAEKLPASNFQVIKEPEAKVDPGPQPKKEEPKASSTEAPKQDPKPKAENHSQNGGGAKPPPLPPRPVSERFPDIDAHRDLVLSLLEGGCNADEVWAVLDNNRAPFERARIKEYIEALMGEMFPVGRTQPRLFQIKDPGRLWEDEMEILSIPWGRTSDSWTVRDVCQGTLILGATGCGKTTGSGRAIAANFLRMGFGGLILTAKQGEAAAWRKLAGNMDRGQDVADICPDGYLRLNMLQYELDRPSTGVKFSENLVSFFKNLASIVGHRANAQVNESFWVETGNELIQNTVDCFLLADFPITLDNLCSFILEAPKSVEQAADRKWQTMPIFGTCMLQAEEACKSEADPGMFKILCEYWLNSFPALPQNTRGCIVAAFSAMVRGLRARYINGLLSTITTITPESIFNGRLVILDLPVNEFQEAGLLVQAAWKYVFQRAVLSRTDRNWGPRCRPVFLWEDEAQATMIDNDAKFQPVAREYRVACVKLSQNISNFYARFGGGDAARTKVDAVIGSLNTKIWHANGDQVTNDWASRYLGTDYKTIISTSTSPPPRYTGWNPLEGIMHWLNGRPSVVTNEQPVREPVMHPHEFSSLQTGSRENGWVTQAVISQVGRTFKTGKSYTCTYFPQIVASYPHERP